MNLLDKYLASRSTLISIITNDFFFMDRKKLCKKTDTT
jgi:hypothetical protein